MEVVNESDRDIYALHNYESNSVPGPMWRSPFNEPSTYLVRAGGGVNNNALRLVRPRCLEKKVYDTRLLFFVYDRALYDSAAENELKNLPFETYAFTLDDLRELGWRIVYPKDARGREYEW